MKDSFNLEEAYWKQTEALVRCVPQYAALRQITLERVNVSEIQSLSRFVNATRLQFASNLIQKYQTACIDVYKPVVLTNDAVRRLIAPPVVEWHEGRPILFDGTHRVWTALRNGMKWIYVLSLRDVNLPLPCEITPWGQVTVRPDKYSRNENLRSLNMLYYRPVTDTFNSDRSILLE